ncbi:hypothetical protein [Siminovitchia fordii]|uniref:hypothetical protein n=1 Tax=Siminovitchia fordii TaxID=254759 RepID=UPI00035E969D|nr:hypothetical protein [Siminovitchia fordii]
MTGTLNIKWLSFVDDIDMIDARLKEMLHQMTRDDVLPFQNLKVMVNTCISSIRGSNQYE